MKSDDSLWILQLLAGCSFPVPWTLGLCLPLLHAVGPGYPGKWGRTYFGSHCEAKDPNEYTGFLWAKDSSFIHSSTQQTFIVYFIGYNCAKFCERQK